TSFSRDWSSDVCSSDLVGGGPNAVSEGLLTALSIMRENSLPGLWVILTQFDPEPIPDENGTTTNAVSCLGAALALVAAGPARGTDRKSVGWGKGGGGGR